MGLNHVGGNWVISLLPWIFKTQFNYQHTKYSFRLESTRNSWAHGITKQIWKILLTCSQAYTSRSLIEAINLMSFNWLWIRSIFAVVFTISFLTLSRQLRQWQCSSLPSLFFLLSVLKKLLMLYVRTLRTTADPNHTTIFHNVNLDR